MDAFDLECNCIYEVTYACTQADPVKWKSMLARVGVSALYFKTAIVSLYRHMCDVCVVSDWWLGSLPSMLGVNMALR